MEHYNPIVPATITIIAAAAPTVNAAAALFDAAADTVVDVVVVFCCCSVVLLRGVHFFGCHFLSILHNRAFGVRETTCYETLKKRSLHFS